MRRWTLRDPGKNFWSGGKNLFNKTSDLSKKV